MALAIDLVYGAFSTRFVLVGKMVLWTNGMNAKGQFAWSAALSLKATMPHVIFLIGLVTSAKLSRDFLILVLVAPTSISPYVQKLKAVIASSVMPTVALL